MLFTSLLAPTIPPTPPYWPVTFVEYDSQARIEPELIYPTIPPARLTYSCPLLVCIEMPLLPAFTYEVAVIVEPITVQWLIEAYDVKCNPR